MNQEEERVGDLQHRYHLSSLRKNGVERKELKKYVKKPKIEGSSASGSSTKGSKAHQGVSNVFVPDLIGDNEQYLPILYDDYRMDSGVHYGNSQDLWHPTARSYDPTTVIAVTLAFFIFIVVCLVVNCVIGTGCYFLGRKGRNVRLKWNPVRVEELEEVYCE